MHVFEYPVDKKLVIRYLKSDVKKAYLLADPWRKSLEVKREGDAVVIQMPNDAPDPVDTVVALEFDGCPVVDEPASAATASSVAPELKRH